MSIPRVAQFSRRPCIRTSPDFGGSQTRTFSSSPECARACVRNHNEKLHTLFCARPMHPGDALIRETPFLFIAESCPLSEAETATMLASSPHRDCNHTSPASPDRHGLLDSNPGIIHYYTIFQSIAKSESHHDHHEGPPTPNTDLVGFATTYGRGLRTVSDGDRP